MPATTSPKSKPPDKVEATEENPRPQKYPPVKRKTKKKLPRSRPVPPAEVEAVGTEHAANGHVKAPQKAVKASKTTAKRPATKKVAKAAGRRRKVPTPVAVPTLNPFRPGSNSWHYTEALKIGGKRSAIVRQLLKKIVVHPWHDEEYADPFPEVDKRLTMVVKELENKWGFSVERRGRGSESFVKVIPPPETPRKRTRRTEAV